MFQTILNFQLSTSFNEEIGLTWLDFLWRHGSVGSWSCCPCCTCLCFPRPGPHNWTCAARSKEFKRYFMNLYDTCISCIILYQILLLVYICFSSAGSERNTLRNYHSSSHCSCFKFRSKLFEGAAPRSSQCLSQTGYSWFLTLTPDWNDDANKDSEDL